MGSNLRRKPATINIETASGSQTGNSCTCFGYDDLRTLGGCLDGQLSIPEHMKRPRAGRERWRKKEKHQEIFSERRTRTCFVEMTEVDSTGIGSGQRRVEGIAPCLACLGPSSRVPFSRFGMPPGKLEPNFSDFGAGLRKRALGLPAFRRPLGLATDRRGRLPGHRSLAWGIPVLIAKGITTGGKSAFLHSICRISLKRLARSQIDVTIALDLQRPTVLTGKWKHLVFFVLMGFPASRITQLGKPKTVRNVACPAI